MDKPQRWEKNGKQILKRGVHFADCRNLHASRIIRQALWCRDWLPLMLGVSVAANVAFWL